MFKTEVTDDLVDYQDQSVIPGHFSAFLKNVVASAVWFSFFVWEGWK